MKILVKEVEEEGLESLLGRTVTIFCANYIYTGELVGVNHRYVKLSSAKVVYETGDFTTKDWKNAQSLPKDWYVSFQSIESFGELK